jgi:hypothetical protein
LRGRRGVADGIGWLLEPYVVDCVTFARDIDPVDLVCRLGARPDQRPRRVSAEEAVDLLPGLGAGSVARVGRGAHGWSFAIEYGADAVGATDTGLKAVSRDGVEAVNFALTPWHPPSMFSYYKGGTHICSFGIGEASRRWGQDPDLLVPALEKIGVLPGRREVSEADRQRAQRLSMLTIQDHFGLRLPRGEAVDGQLPLFLVRER